MGIEYIRNTNSLNYPSHYGNILLYDSFEGLLKWGKTGTGSDYVVEKFGQKAYNGDYCLLLRTRTTSPLPDSIVRATRLPSIRSIKQVTVQFNFSVYEYNNPRYLEFHYAYANLTDYISPKIRYDFINSRLEYMVFGGTWKIAGQQNIIISTNYWYNVKATWNFTTKKWISISLANFNFNISDDDIDWEAFDEDIYSCVYITLQSYDTGVPSILIDDFLLLEE